MIELSFIVPCLNSSKTINETLTSIFAQQTDFEFEVIVVDNGSSDHTIELARQFDVTVIRENKRGPGLARNAGIKAASGRYIAFVDSDVTLEPTWAQVLMNYISKYKLLAAQGQVILSSNGNSLLDSYRTAHKTNHPTDWISLATSDYKVGHINTAACIYKAQALKQVKGFSTSIRYHEDVDLTLKIRSLPDGAIGCTREAKSYCFYTQTLASYLKRAFVYGFHLAVVAKKWNYKKSFPVLSRHWGSLQLSLFDCLVNTLSYSGYRLGVLSLRFHKSETFEKESKFIQMIAALPKHKDFKVYFECEEIHSLLKQRVLS